MPSNNFAEMICEACVTKHAFLLHYDMYCINKAPQIVEEEKKDDVNVEEIEEHNEANNKESCKKPKYKSPKVTAKFWEDVSRNIFFYF